MYFVEDLILCRANVGMTLQTFQFICFCACIRKDLKFLFLAICYSLRMLRVLTEQLLLWVERQCPVLT